MPARLTLFPTSRPARVVYLNEGEGYPVGRSSECQICVPDEQISRHHARIEGNADGWTIRDLDSRNGTTVDGKKLAAETTLPRASWLAFGGLLGRFEILSEIEADEARQNDMARRRSSLEVQRHLTLSRGLDPLLAQVLDSVLRLGGADRGFVGNQDGDHLGKGLRATPRHCRTG